MLPQSKLGRKQKQPSRPICQSSNRAPRLNVKEIATPFNWNLSFSRPRLIVTSEGFHRQTTYHCLLITSDSYISLRYISLLNEQGRSKSLRKDFFFSFHFVYKHNKICNVKKVWSGAACASSEGANHSKFLCLFSGAEFIMRENKSKNGNSAISKSKKEQLTETLHWWDFCVFFFLLSFFWAELNLVSRRRTSTS